ncbi:MAG: cytochrome-c peroxidase [bacterium]|nr:cytochrome-c peroxidase [bacterium]
MKLLKYSVISLSLLGLYAVIVTSVGADKLAYQTIFKPLPPVTEVTPDSRENAMVSLGERLYFETALSLDNDLSCNSCHKLDAFGVDNEKTSPGHKGQRGGRNSPTVYNSALNIAQFWDGRAADVEAQALGPILNPIEMAMPDEAAVLARLVSSDVVGGNYPQLFAKAFPEEKEPLTYKNVGAAIGAFERTLLTPSAFDDYLMGDESALTAEEQKGLQRFVETGCVACHAGVGIGGGMYQKLGLVVPYESADQGRYDVTKTEADRHVFKVPSLRNIVKTSPYFHDGSIATLEEAVKLMGKHQLGKDLSDAEINEIVVFLGALTGRIPLRASTESAGCAADTSECSAEVSP